MVLSSTNATTTIARTLFEMQCSIKLHHWKTTSHARHVAADTLVKSITGQGDRMIEAMAVRYGRPDGVGAIKVNALADEEVAKYLEATASRFWGTHFDKLIHKKDTDLYSIRDEVVAAIHQAMYLMTLS